MKQLSRCPVCDSEDLRFSYEGQTRLNFDDKLWRIDRCGSCSHEFLNPQPSWEELAPYYDASNYSPYTASHGSEASDEEVVARARAAGEFRHVKIRPGLRLLDVGCGGGYFLRITSKLGAIGEGVEPSVEGAKVAAQSTGLPIFQGTLEDYVQSHPDRRFDLITASHVVEHTPTPVETFKAMASLLAPGGRVWISVPNADCVDSRKLKSRWHSAELPLHLMHFTPDSLRKAGERAGLVPESVVTYSLPGGAAESLRQTLRFKYFIPRRVTALLGPILGPKLATRMDAMGRGEAIIAELATAGA